MLCSILIASQQREGGFYFSPSPLDYARASRTPDKSALVAVTSKRTEADVRLFIPTEYPVAESKAVRKWRLAHPEYYKEYWKKHRAERARYDRQYKEKHPDAVANRKREWRRANPEKVTAHKHRSHQAHRESNNEKTRQWRQQNPGRVSLLNHRRRDRESNTVTALRADDITAMLKSGCFFADDSCSGPLTVAHDVPIAKGGHTTRGNTFVLCRHHNSEMHTKSLSEMLVQKGLF